MVRTIDSNWNTDMVWIYVYQVDSRLTSSRLNGIINTFTAPYSEPSGQLFRDRSINTHVGFACEHEYERHDSL